MFETWWQLLIIIVVGGVIILSVISTVKTGKIGITLGKGGVSVTTDPSNPDGCGECFRVSDIARIIQLQEEVSRRVQHIEDIELVRDQMNYAEERLDAIEGLMLPIFLRELREDKGGARDGLISTTEAVSYRNCLALMKERLLTVARHMFRENHLAEKGELEFEAYVRAKRKIFCQKKTTVLNEIFPPGISPSREDIYEANREIIDEIEGEFDSIIRHGRMIAVEKRNEIALLRAEFEKKFGEIIE